MMRLSVEWAVSVRAFLAVCRETSSRFRRLSSGQDFDFSSPALPHAFRPLMDTEKAIQEQAGQTNLASSPRPSQPRTVLHMARLSYS